jgi:predicted DNA-binding protein
VEDEYRPVLRAQPAEAPLQLVALGDDGRLVGGERWRERREFDLDGSPAPAAGDVETGIHRQPVDPRVESIRIAQPRQVSPGSDERVLDGVPGEILVAKDQASDRLEPTDRPVEKHGEGVMIAPPGSLDEFLLAHRHPRAASPWTPSRLLASPRGKPFPSGAVRLDARARLMYVSYIMKRTQIYLEADQDRRLARRATAVGTTKSTLIREAIESYLSTSNDEAARLAEFHAALDAIERSPADLPDGRTYVEQLRRADRERDEEIEKHRR